MNQKKLTPEKPSLSLKNRNGRLYNYPIGRKAAVTRSSPLPLYRSLSINTGDRKPTPFKLATFTWVR